MNDIMNNHNYLELRWRTKIIFYIFTE